MHARQKTRIGFNERFLPTQIDGEVADTAIVSLLALTMERTARTASEKLQLGALRQARTMGRGEAAAFTFGEPRSVSLYDDVSAWADLRNTNEPPRDDLVEYPVVPQAPEIHHLLREQTAARACSFQRLSSGNWEHFTFDNALGILELEAVAMLLLQMDVICREQAIPRGRLHVQWEQGEIWFWVSEMENLMMILTGPNPTPADLDLFCRCGDAFQLT